MGLPGSAEFGGMARAASMELSETTGGRDLGGGGLETDVLRSTPTELLPASRACVSVCSALLLSDLSGWGATGGRGLGLTPATSAVAVGVVFVALDSLLTISGAGAGFVGGGGRDVAFGVLELVGGVSLSVVVVVGCSAGLGLCLTEGRGGAAVTTKGNYSMR